MDYLMYDINPSFFCAGIPWLPNDINNGYLELYILVLAGILFVDFIFFILLARRYTYSHLGVISASSKPDLLQGQPTMNAGLDCSVKLNSTVFAASV